MTDTTNSNTHTVNIMKYACVHFFKEGNQFDIVESSKLEEIGDQCICQWKDKQYPVKVLGYGDNIQKLNSEYLEETDCEMSDCTLPSPGRRLRRRISIDSNNNEDEVISADKEKRAKRCLMKKNSAMVMKQESEKIIESIKIKRCHKEETLETEVAHLRKIRKKYEHNLQKMTTIQESLANELTLLQNLRENQKTNQDIDNGRSLREAPVGTILEKFQPYVAETEDESTSLIEVETAEDAISSVNTTATEEKPEVEFTVSEAFIANNSSPTMSRYVCELMSTNLTRQYMASHSLSGQNGVKGPNCTVVYKPAIDQMYVKKLIDHVMSMPQFKKDDLPHSAKTIRFAIGKRMARAAYMSKKT